MTTVRHSKRSIQRLLLLTFILTVLFTAYSALGAGCEERNAARSTMLLGRLSPASGDGRANDSVFATTPPYALNPTVPTTGEPFTLNVTLYLVEGSMAVKAGISLDNRSFYDLPMQRVWQNATQATYSLDSATIEGAFPAFSTANHTLFYCNFTVGTVDGMMGRTDRYAVQITDNDPPTLVGAVPRVETTTGERFTLTIDATDNIGVAAARFVTVAPNGSRVAAPFDKVAEGNFRLDAAALSDALGWFSANHSGVTVYWIVLVDAAGNSVESEHGLIVIHDDDPPVLVHQYFSPAAPAIGAPFRLLAQWRDETGVENCTLRLEGTTGAGYEFRMTPRGDDLFSIDRSTMVAQLPSLSWAVIERFDYSFIASDGAANRHHTALFTMALADTNPPRFINFTSELNVTSGDAFVIDVNVTDTVGLETVFIHLYRDANQLGTARMFHRRGAHYRVSYDQLRAIGGFATDHLDAFGFYIEAVDGAGNANFSANGSVTVIDNDPPAFHAGSGNFTTAVHNMFILEVEFYDNTNVSYCVVYIRKQTSAVWRYYSIPLEPGATRVELLKSALETDLGVDLDRPGEYEYYFTVTDRCGNRGTYGNASAPYRFDVIVPAGSTLALLVMIVAVPIGSVVGFIVIRRLLLGPYELQQLYLIYDDGCLIKHLQASEAERVGKDQIAAMFTAIQDFVRDSFSDDVAGYLDQLKLGEMTILFQRRGPVILAAVINGYPHSEVRYRMKRVLNRIMWDYRSALEDWDGSPDSVDGIEFYLRRLMPQGNERTDTLARMFDGFRTMGALGMDEGRAFETLDRDAKQRSLEDEVGDDELYGTLDDDEFVFVVDGDGDGEGEGDDQLDDDEFVFVADGDGDGEGEGDDQLDDDEFVFVAPEDHRSK